MKNKILYKLNEFSNSILLVLIFYPVYLLFYNIKITGIFSSSGKRIIKSKNTLGSCLINLSKSRFDFLNIYNCGINNKITISNSTNIKSLSVYFVGDNLDVFIGNNTTIEDAHFSVVGDNTHITIGSNCMFANNIKIRTGDSHPILTNNQIINNPSSIEIGDSVWLADDVIVLKGSFVDNGCIIGARSIVTQSSVSNVSSLLVGTPAKVIRDGIKWER